MPAHKPAAEDHSDDHLRKFGEHVGFDVTQMNGEKFHVSREQEFAVHARDNGKSSLLKLYATQDGRLCIIGTKAIKETVAEVVRLVGGA